MLALLLVFTVQVLKKSQRQKDLFGRIRERGGGEKQVLSIHIVSIHTCFRIKIRGEDILIVSNVEHFVYSFTTLFYPQLKSGIQCPAVPFTMIQTCSKAD